MFDLTGKAALVTGGNGGIGLGMARALGAAGCAVAIAARNAAKSAEAVRTLRDAGCEALAVEVDAADEASVQAAVDGVARHFGHLDILVNNAGINLRAPPQEMSLDTWRSVMDTNLTSAFLCAKAAWPHMKRAGAGKVINIGSMMSVFGASYAPAYAASKGGVVQLTRSQAIAWAPDNIQVNAILPGWVDTALTRQARDQVAGLHERVLARTPAGRWGDAADFAGVAVFLSSAASDFVTGAAIPVDGGYSVMG